MRLTSFIAALPLFAVCMMAKADTLFSTPDVTEVGGYISYTGSFKVAAPFSLSSDATINHVSFEGFYGQASAITDQFTLNIFASDNGLPAAALETWTASASRSYLSSSSGFQLYQFDSSVPAFSAKAGVLYFLGAFNTSPAGSFAWSVAAGDSGYHAELNNGTTNYYSFPDQLAFGIYGTNAVAATPEPSSLAMIIPGILGIVRLARSRSSRRA